MHHADTNHCGWHADSSQLLVAAGKSGGALLTCTVSFAKPKDASNAASIHCSPAHMQRGAHSSRLVTGVAWASVSLPLQQTKPQQALMHGQSIPQQGDSSLQAAKSARSLEEQIPGSFSHVSNAVMDESALHDESAPQQHTAPNASVCSGGQEAGIASFEQQSLFATHAIGETDGDPPAINPLLISSGADGQIRLWQHAPEGLLQQPCPEAWSCPSLEKDKAFQPLGVAVSGNGLLLAVAVDNGTAASAAVQ